HKLALPPLPNASNGNGAAASPAADEAVDIYSLYMHQLDWAGYQAAEQSAASADDSIQSATPAIQRMMFWKGDEKYRVGAKASDKQEAAADTYEATAAHGPGVPGAAPPINVPHTVGIYIYNKPNGKVIGLLPQSAELTVTGASVSGWAKIASISTGAPVGLVQGTPPAVDASTGWIQLDELDSLIVPSVRDTVVVLDKPFRVKAGDLVGYLGQYVRHSDASALPASTASRPLLHVEVFAGDPLKAFIDKSRQRAAQFSDNEKPLLVVSPGTALLAAQDAVPQTVPAGTTLKAVAGKSGRGPWRKVQPIKITPGQPTHAHPHPKAAESVAGDALWVEQALVGQVVPDSGTVPGWKQFPLQLSNAPVATASFLDVLTPEELRSLDSGATAVDDNEIKWWKVEVGTGSGTSGVGWICSLGHPRTEWQSPWAWPGFELVDGSSVKMADVFKRSIAVNGLALPDEESAFQASAVAVNASELFTKLEKAIDLDGDGTITSQELATAHGTSWLADALSHLIVRYESEWGGGLEKWNELTPLMKSRAPDWTSEMQRIEKLRWWDPVKAAKHDFPQEPTVYHFHPIGLIGNFSSDVCRCGCCYVDKFRVTRAGHSYGPIYSGDRPLERATVLADMVSNGELTESEYRIVVAMSANEGKIDTVQAYDSEILTAGAMQKTINPSGAGEFPAQVAQFKKDNEEAYVELFEKCGWTVEVDGKHPVMKYSHPTLTGGAKLTGTPLRDLIRRDCSQENFGKPIKNIPLAVIAHAITTKAYEKRQIMDFIDRLRNEVLVITPSNYSFPISSYFKSDLGRATALDQHVNRPGYVGRDVAKSLDRFFAQHPDVPKNPDNWGESRDVYEREIVETYGVIREMAVVNHVPVAPGRYVKLAKVLA
ncbi:MAG TPA: hypothetical protein VJQ54_05860, partial [Candidatus Sulfotelmatobacter sp.]|nr:hypothetical protein [Candidatus Sulfotelmatobacter sp.]